MKISEFSKVTRVIYPKNCPNQICGYWLITQNQQKLCIETNILAADSYKSASVQLQNSGQLQNNFFNGAVLIAMSCVINN